MQEKCITRLRQELPNENHQELIALTQYQHGAAEDGKARYVVDQAYCSRGCSILDEEHPIHGHPGLRIGFSRPGMKGEFVLSAIQEDFDKIMLSGELIDGVKLDLYCPHCGTPFATLANCRCSADAQIVTIGLTPKLDFNNGIAFCNVAGCKNEGFVLSSRAIQSVWTNDGRY